MSNLFDGYGVRDLDDIRTAVEAVYRAMDLSSQDEHTGAGTLRDAVERIYLQVVESMGEERAVKGLAALVYGLTIDSSTTPLSWKHIAADHIVDQLKSKGEIEQR